MRQATAKHLRDETFFAKLFDQCVETLGLVDKQRMAGLLEDFHLRARAILLRFSRLRFELWRNDIKQRLVESGVMLLASGCAQTDNPTARDCLPTPFVSRALINPATSVR